MTMYTAQLVLYRCNLCITIQKSTPNSSSIFNTFPTSTKTPPLSNKKKYDSKITETLICAETYFLTFFHQHYHLHVRKAFLKNYTYFLKAFFGVLIMRFFLPNKLLDGNLFQDYLCLHNNSLVSSPNTLATKLCIRFVPAT